MTQLMEPLRVRGATIEDAFAIASVHVLTWHGSYRGIVADEYIESLTIEEGEEVWRERLGFAGPMGMLVLVAEGSQSGIFGFASGGPNREANLAFDAEMYALYVRPESQHRGAGRALVRSLAAGLIGRGYHALAVAVLARNPARAFYEALGARYLDEQPRIIGGTPYREARYGWDDLQQLVT